jgi:hypothetical protein
VPEQSSGDHESAAPPQQTGEPSGRVRSAPFDRLLSVAVLTPAQASLVAVRLLDAASMGGLVDSEGVARIGVVTLMSSGDVHVSCPDADNGVPVTELLRKLLHNARRLPVHPRHEQLLLLQGLEVAAAAPLLEPGARARALEEALVDTLGSTAWQRLSEQLGALVDAFARIAPSVPRPVDGVPDTGTGVPSIESLASPRVVAADRGSSGSAPHPARPAGHAPSPPPRRSRALRRSTRGRHVALVALVLAAVLAGAGYFALRNPGMGIVESLGLGSRTAAPTTTAPDRTSQQPAEQLRRPRHVVPALAGRHAGPITRVVVEKAGSCKPGTLCPVKVTVQFRPASTSRPFRWKVGVARSCKRGITWSAPTTVTAQPGWTTVHAQSSVRVPKGRSLALTALTIAPARAQSRPVPVTGSSLRC